MLINSRLDLFLLVALLCAPQIPARQDHSLTFPGNGEIHLDVVVTAKSGMPVSGLQQQDFTVLDNKVPQSITSFQAIDGRTAPVQVTLVVDAVNTEYRNVGVEQEGIERFLRADGGRLRYPTNVAVLTDAGVQFEEEVSSDGNAVAATMEKSTVAIREIRGSAGFYGATERLKISLDGLKQLLGRVVQTPDRKIIVWVSPGWPLLAGPGLYIGAKQEQQIFQDIVTISTQLQQAGVTLYSIDPLGTADVGMRAMFWQSYVKGVSKPTEAQPGNLALEVFATQSGGLALNASNDIAAQLQKCVADRGMYYELSFKSAEGGKPQEYHHLEVRVAQLGLTARTRQGYYSRTNRTGTLEAESPMPGWGKDDTPAHKPGSESEVAVDTKEKSPYGANAHPYIDEPVARLVERIPELENLQPAPDQQELPVILQKMGRNVDDFIRNIGDLLAHEDVTQEKLNADGKIKAKEHVQVEYLILHHGNELGAGAEYRMDKKGNRLGPIGMKKGYLVTSGFAFNCISFSTVAQAQSRFRYFGEEVIESRETYVMGFAQQPGATFTTATMGTGGKEVDMLMQGILWVDKNSFQIIRLRTDLLAPNEELRLDQQTTVIAFGEVKLPDLPNPLWLPNNVDVYMKVDGHKFRNVHQYTNYRHYRVSVKIGGVDLKDSAVTGQFTVQVQDNAGAPFSDGATVTLLTSNSATRLSMVSDPSGQARFNSLPVGQYAIEVTVPGYRTFHQQVVISATREAQNVVASMVPSTIDANAKGGSVSVPPKAIKETEKALRALQQNNLDDAQQYLVHVLTIDPHFADANYLMGLLLLRRNESGRAVAYLQKSLELSPNHAVALLALGEAQYLEHDYVNAIASLEKCLHEQPNSSEAPAAQKYVDAMRRFLQQKPAGDAETLAVTSSSPPSGANDTKAPVANLGGTDSALPPLAEVAPTTEVNWAPPDVDDEKLDLAPSASCRLGEVMQSASQRVEELVGNVDRYTATENMEHFELSPMGLKISHETRKFNYLVEIRQVGKSDLDVQDYRSGWVQPERIRGFPALEEFPGNIVTVGIPLLALIFHPYFQPRYDFACEGRGSWQGRPAWIVHFRQRTDQTSSLLTYHVDNRSIAVGLKGRAWIDTDSSQIVAMESDILSPVPEIHLLRDHQLIEYGPLRFRNKPLELWLPRSADWYCSLNGHRFYRRHTFSGFLLFSVDEKEKISEPKEAIKPSEPE